MDDIVIKKLIGIIPENIVNQDEDLLKNILYDLINSDENSFTEKRENVIAQIAKVIGIVWAKEYVKYNLIKKNNKKNKSDTNDESEKKKLNIDIKYEDKEENIVLAEVHTATELTENEDEYPQGEKYTEKGETVIKRAEDIRENVDNMNRTSEKKYESLVFIYKNTKIPDSIRKQIEEYSKIVELPIDVNSVYDYATKIVETWVRICRDIKEKIDETREYNIPLYKNIQEFYTKNEFANLEGFKDRYERLRLILQGKKPTEKITEEDKQYLKGIEFNNILMTILHIEEASFNAKVDMNTKKEHNIQNSINELFKEFLISHGVEISNPEEAERYISLFRNAIAHHGYYIDVEKGNIEFNKKEFKGGDKSIFFTTNIDQLTHLAYSLLSLFKNNPEIQKHFLRGLRLNTFIDKIINDEEYSVINYHQSIEDIDLSYSFYISSLFDLIKYSKTVEKSDKSFYKRFKERIRSDTEISRMLYGIDSKKELERNDIMNELDYSETIKSLIMFYYNAYPDELTKVFDKGYNEKTIQQLIDEYCVKIAEERKDITDFEKMIDNKEENPQIEELKKKLITDFFLKLPSIYRLYVSDDLMQLIPNMKALLDGFIMKKSDDRELVYWTKSDEKTRDSTNSIMENIRNAIIHGRLDVNYSETGEPLYDFQDTDEHKEDDDKDHTDEDKYKFTNFLIKHVTSEQLNSMISIIADALLEEKNKEEEKKDYIDKDENKTNILIKHVNKSEKELEIKYDSIEKIKIYFENIIDRIVQNEYEDIVKSIKNDNRYKDSKEIENDSKLKNMIGLKDSFIKEIEQLEYKEDDKGKDDGKGIDR